MKPFFLGDRDIYLTYYGRKEKTLKRHYYAMCEQKPQELQNTTEYEVLLLFYNAAASCSASQLLREILRIKVICIKFSCANAWLSH